MQSQSFRRWRYSSLAAGIFVIPLAGLIRLVAASISGSPVPSAWLVCIAVGAGISLALHFVSTRVLFARLLELAAAVLLLAALWAFADATLRGLVAQPAGPLWPLATGAAMIAAFTAGFVRDQRSWFRAQLPCGYEGRLDERTGMVDPGGPTPQRAQQPMRRSPFKNPALQLIAGLVLAQIAIAFLPATARLVLLLALVVYLVAVFAFAGGRVASVCVATWRWERRHGKPIRVAR